MSEVENREEEYKEVKTEVVITEVETGMEDEFGEVPEGLIEEVKKKEENPEKIAVYNEDAISAEKDKADSEGDKTESCFPSFFIDEDDTQDIKVDILSDRENGKILSISRAGLVDMSEFEYLTATEVKFTFSVPTYDDIIKYRQECRTFDRDANKSIVDNVQMRNFYLVWHLKDWTLTDSKGEKVELAHEENGALKDSSIKCVYKMPASVLDVILTLFEKDVLIS
jgi:hypothetical protein